MPKKLNPFFFFLIILFSISFLSVISNASSISSFDHSGINKLFPVGVLAGGYGVNGGNLSCVQVMNDGKTYYANNGYSLTFNFSTVNLYDLPLAHIYLSFNAYTQTGWILDVYAYNGSNMNPIWDIGTNGGWLYRTIDLTRNFTSPTSLQHIEISFVGSSGGGGTPPIHKVDYVEVDVVLGYEWLKNGGFEDYVNQHNVTTYSHPWWCYETGNSMQGIAPTNVNFGQHSGWQNYVYFGFRLPDSGKGTGGEPIYQTINFLDSNLVSGVSMWIYKTGTAIIRLDLWYSDGTHSFSVVQKNNTGLLNWQFISFSNFIQKNKLINRFSFTLLSGSTYDMFWIDNVSLVAGVPAGQTSFSWDIRPDVLSRGNNTFRAYQGQEYVFSGAIYANNGTICGNGTASMTSDLTTNIIHVPIVNGTFTLPISARSSSILGEMHEILMFKTTYSTIRNCTVILEATWINQGTTQDQTTGMINGVLPLIIPIMFLVVPTLLLGALGGFGGMFIGLLIGVICLWFAGMIPTWMLYLIGIGLVFLLVFGSGRIGIFKNESENE